MFLNLIFLLNTSVSLFMTGLIWVIQLVHYPVFRFTDEENFSDFHTFHNRNISLIVVPVMITELVSSGILWWNYGFSSLHGIGFYLVLAIWVATALLSVPNHAKLSSGKNIEVIDALVKTNWIRTILWTLKAVISLIIAYELIS